MKFRSRLNVFCQDENGASMVEYGVALLVVAAIGVTMLTALGDATETNVQAACDAVTAATC